MATSIADQTQEVLVVLTCTHSASDKLKHYILATTYLKASHY